MILSPEYFEMHITLRPQHKEVAEEIAKSYQFKTSQIAGDQVLGDDVFLYLTGKDVDRDRLFERMDAATRLLRVQNVPVVRRKIEHIIYDQRF